ncbi:MAG: sialate O-acetylesterase [Planctomycetota bacterium]|nr:sialate O-acetylesterase [Planctomycetota bacterium]
MRILFLTISVFMVAMALPRSGLAEKTQVFILAGQSNMQGQGVVDLDHPMHYNGGKGTLNRVMENPKTKASYAHIKNNHGDFVVRDDVFVRYVTPSKLKRGGLSVGFTGYDGNHHIGPEFQFGHVVGSVIKQPVLLIKTAWGGKSIYKDFRPPSSGGQVGAYYRQMISEIKQGLDQIPVDFPHLNKRYELRGFVWFQGWNDMYDEDARSQYEQNLVNLIGDVRREFEVPDLPVVIGELGNGGEDVSDNMKSIRNAQKTAAEKTHHAYFVKTTQFARPKEQSPNVGHGHHWFGNAESYFLIGDALGKKMLELQVKK